MLYRLTWLQNIPLICKLEGPAASVFDNVRNVLSFYVVWVIIAAFVQLWSTC